jgi:dipeptidyl-peptidase-4
MVKYLRRKYTIRRIFMKLFRLQILLAIFILVPAAFGQSDSAEFANAEQFLPANVVPTLYNMTVAPNWISGTHSFWYINDAREGREFVLVNTTGGGSKTTFNRTSLAKLLSAVFGVAVDPSGLSLFDMPFQNGTIVFSALNRTWQCDLKMHTISAAISANPKAHFFKSSRHGEVYTIAEAKSLVAAGPGEMLSPDGSLAVYIQDHNLWCRDIGSDIRYPLTTDGSEDYAYAERSGTVLHPVSQIRLNETPSPYAVWSPDSKEIATFRMDQREVSLLNLLQYVPGNDSRPTPRAFRFAMPDDEHVPMYEQVVINISDRKAIPVSYRLQPEVSLMDTDVDVLQWWSDDGQVLYSLYAERGEKALVLLKTNPHTGDTEELLRESSPAYAEANLDYASIPNVRVLKNGDIVWFSEKSGYGHLYLYGSDGREKHAITSGPWAVRKLLAVDENSSTVYFTAGGRETGYDPYYRLLYKVDLNGSGLTLLTPEEADHNVQMVPDGSAFVDTYSSVDQPPVMVLRDLSGNVTMTLEKGDTKSLADMGWRPPETFRALALDGKTELYGLIIKPTSFNSSRKYPVVETVYPGPWIIATAKSFPGDMSWVNRIFWRGQALAELGFVVVTMDGPGTPYRSKEFHDASYGHLGNAGGLADHINALKQLAAERPYMDLSRVGMFGHSAGGFMTAQALLTYPDFYKVGLASSGDYDSRFYGAYWGEKYEGLKANYTEQETARKAGNLEGNLLLVTGDVDDNVNPCMTMQLVDALIKADKPFDLLVMTNQNHDLSYDPYYIHRLFSYFTEHLSNTGPG